MPGTNLKQDALRARIRGGEARATTPTGRQWLASTDTRRFYSYEFGQDGRLVEPTVYELDEEAVHLAQVVSGKTGTWTEPITSEDQRRRNTVVERYGGRSRRRRGNYFRGVESPTVFKPTIDKPSQLSAQRFAPLLEAAKQRGIDVSALAVACNESTPAHSALSSWRSSACHWRFRLAGRELLSRYVRRWWWGLLTGRLAAGFSNSEITDCCGRQCGWSRC